MRDPRLQTLAKNIVQYSVSVQPGERVLIDMHGEEREIVKALIEEVYAAGGQPFIHLVDASIQRTLLTSASRDQIQKWAEFDCHRMSEMQAYIAVRAGANATELADVPREQTVSGAASKEATPALSESNANICFLLLDLRNSTLLVEKQPLLSL
jgi:aminopeptidase